MDIREEFLAIVDALNAAHIDYAVCGGVSGIVVSRGYTDGLLTGVSAQEGQATAFLDQSFGYDAASRLSTVEVENHDVGYSYHPTSSLTKVVAFTNGTSEVMTTAWAYDRLNRLTAISSSNSSGAVNSHGYTYEGMARRVRVDLAGGDYWEYDYDELGQVVSGVKKQSDGTAYPGQEFEYGFDDIGNRTEATANGETSDYNANLLNQYTSRTVPGVVDLIGEAAASAWVTVNEEQTSRLGSYFHGQVPVGNTNDVYEELTIVGVLNNVNTTNEDAVATSTRYRFVPEDPETFAYDDDGNMLSDGRWTNTWNGENRLVKMETRSDLASSVPDLTVEFAYDSQGRRFEKTVTSNSVATTTYFLYDGWNLIAELESDLDPIRTYTWGLDLSGSFQGAGGVGGLLAVTDASAGSTYYATYDGNGNVMALVDASDGSVDAVYEYDPFGNIIRATGPAAEANPFRFSTKYTDDETGLVYYGYRYLNTDTGRWISRDPIEEEGGVGLRVFVANNPVALTDPLGLKAFGKLPKSPVPDMPFPVAVGICAAQAVGRNFFNMINEAFALNAFRHKTICDTYIPMHCAEKGGARRGTHWMRRIPQTGLPAIGDSQVAADFAICVLNELIPSIPMGPDPIRMPAPAELDFSVDINVNYKCTGKRSVLYWMTVSLELGSVPNVGSVSGDIPGVVHSGECSSKFNAQCSCCK